MLGGRWDGRKQQDVDASTILPRARSNYSVECKSLVGGQGRAFWMF